MNKYCLLLLLLLFVPAAFAQNAPPPGQGMHPASVIGGDMLPSPSAPSGFSLNTNSTNFANLPEQIPLTIYLRTDTYSHNGHQYMGKRTVLTIRTTMLNVMQLDLIISMLAIDLNSIPKNGEQAISVDVNENQLKNIENILIPVTHQLHSVRQSSPFYYVPMVQKFGRLAVLLGVIFATVMLAIAAHGMVMSHRGSADKIISTVAGLMVLLMAYTIYCLLIDNTRTASMAAVSTNFGQLTQSGSAP